MVMSPAHQVWPNHLARHGDRRKKTRQTEEEVGRQRKRWEDRGRGGKTEEEVGRQRKRWEDYIRTGPHFVKSQTTVKNRGKWRKLVVKSSVVPQRPSRLRNR